VQLETTQWSPELAEQDLPNWDQDPRFADLDLLWVVDVADFSSERPLLYPQARMKTWIRVNRFINTAEKAVEFSLSPVTAGIGP
jgi:hypothetical protein